jgi:hypothetical protein
MKKKLVRWKALEWYGTEILNFHPCRASGLLQGEINNQLYEIYYFVAFTYDWQIESLSVESLISPQRIKLYHDNGQWYDQDDTHLEAFDGVDFVDISLSPFTNSFPINGLDWNESDNHTMDVIYFDLPKFSIRRVNQTYTKLNDQSYRYQDGEIPSFVADIEVDQEGFVVSYPGLFVRTS